MFVKKEGELEGGGKGEEVGNSAPRRERYAKRCVVGAWCLTCDMTMQVLYQHMLCHRVLESTRRLVLLQHRAVNKVCSLLAREEVLIFNAYSQVQR